MLVQYGVPRPSLLRQSATIELSNDWLICAAFALVTVLLIGLTLHFQPGSGVGQWIASGSGDAAGLNQFMLVP
jgi:hypothetical protein